MHRFEALLILFTEGIGDLLRLFMLTILGPFFELLLTVHLSIILVTDQLNARILVL